jgi:hypothetical protein
MTHYGIYALGKNGRITSGSDADCLDDTAARTLAYTGLKPGESREVWQGTHCVGFFMGAADCLPARDALPLPDTISAVLSTETPDVLVH